MLHAYRGTQQALPEKTVTGTVRSWQGNPVVQGLRKLCL